MIIEVEGVTECLNYVNVGVVLKNGGVWSPG